MPTTPVSPPRPAAPASPGAGAIEGSRGFRTVATNTAWLWADKGLRLVSGLFITAAVARYLGTAGFGLLNYSLSLVELLGTLTSLGMNRLAVRDLVRRPDRAHETLGTLLCLRGAGAVLAVGAAIGAVLLLRPGDFIALSVTAIIACSEVFQITMVIDFWFEATLQVRRSVAASISGLLGASVFRVAAVLLSAPLLCFALGPPLEAAVGAVILVSLYRRDRQRPAGWKPSWLRARTLLAESWPLMLATAASAAYVRIDTLMIASMLGDEAVGVYSAASRISTVWYFVPASIVTAIAPAIAAAKSGEDALFMRRMQQLFDTVALTALVIAIPVTFLADYVIWIVYGAQYSAAASLLTLHVWGGVFASLGMARSVWIVNSGLMRLNLVSVTAGAIVNAILNYVFIPRMGLTGAAVATIASYFVGMVAGNFLFRETRGIGIMQLRALLPFRIVETLRFLMRLSMAARK